MKLKEVIRTVWFAVRENSVQGRIYRFLFFIAVYLAGRYLVNSLNAIGALNWLHLPFLWFINTASVCFWGIFYDSVSSTPEYILSINDRSCIHLLPGCSGLLPTLRMTISLLLYPIPWKTKSWLFPLSWGIILLASTVHFILLIPISYHWPNYYDFSHNWLTKIIFYGIYFLTWLLWEKVGYPMNRKQDVEFKIRQT